MGFRAYVASRSPCMAWRKPSGAGSARSSRGSATGAFDNARPGPCVFVAERDVRGVTQRVILGCYVDDLFPLYTHDGDGSLYDTFTRDLAQGWNVEDEGPISDLLNVDITTDGGHVR
eukprot:6176276-Pleurochrysis_carterae.AAC.3